MEPGIASAMVRPTMLLRRSSVAAGSSSEGGGLRRAPRLWPMRHHATSTGPKIARTVLAAGRLNDGSARTGSAIMRFQTYRDQSRSRHFDLIGGRGHPWQIDLVSVTAAALLMVGFACALLAQLVH